MTTCPETGTLVEQEINRVATQYRESPNLLGLMRAYLSQVEEAIQATCAVPTFFDLDTAVGDQLTLLGKRLGFPRCHCVCDVAPVFGFACGTSPYEIVGFCEGGTWAECRDTGTSTICIDNDEEYRGLLKARRYQALGLYDMASLQGAVRHIWGEGASVSNLGRGRVVVAPGRSLTASEMQYRPVAFRVLPIAPGIKALTSAATGPIFGFGEGWSGLCEDAQWLCPIDPYPYDCP